MPSEPPAELSGLVTRFKGDGRRLGYPTANITTDTDLADGVYFGFADLANWTNHPAIIFIGTPTTMGETERRAEAYLLDVPDKDYYDLALGLKVEYYHRANQKFDSIENLQASMHDDETAARQWFNQHSSSGSVRP